MTSPGTGSHRLPRVMATGATHDPAVTFRPRQDMAIEPFARWGRVTRCPRPPMERTRDAA
jgi:hypothetical protein